MNAKLPQKRQTRLPKHFCDEHTQQNLSNLNAIVDFLVDNKLKITKFRLSLVSLFLNADIHSWTKQQIVKLLEKQQGPINLASLYNNLDLLVRLGILKVNNNPLTQANEYELAWDSGPHIHAYFPKNQTKVVMDVDCDLHDALKAYCLKHNLELENYLIDITVSEKNHH